jgi:hypothetical protein
VLGPKGSSAACDFVIDLHTTTSNMGCTLIGAPCAARRARALHDAPVRCSLLRVRGWHVVNSYCTLALEIAAYVSSAWEEGSSGLEPPSGHAPLLPPSTHPLRVYLHETGEQAAPCTWLDCA